MRKDMQRVIVETIRDNRYASYRNGKRTKLYKDLEDAPTKESMKKRYKEHKQLGDRLSPLRNYLKSKLGQPWDKIWKDICEHNDARSVMGIHVRNHVWQMVDRPGEPQPYWGRSHWFFFIDDNGLLQQYPKREYKRKKKPVTLIFCDDGKILRKEKGIWYFVKKNETQVTEEEYCWFRRRRVPVTRDVVSYAKLKQLNKKELRDYEVKNGK